jgi:hypothetical protein
MPRAFVRSATDVFETLKAIAKQVLAELKKE